MAECQYSIPFSGSAKDFYAAAKQGLEAQGGTIVGNSSAGSASVPTPAGSVTLDYKIAGTVAQIDITDKPFVVSCTQIYDALVQAFPKPSTKKKVVVTNTPAGASVSFEDPYNQYSDSAYQTHATADQGKSTTKQAATALNPLQSSKKADVPWKWWAGGALCTGFAFWLFRTKHES